MPDSPPSEHEFGFVCYCKSLPAESDQDIKDSIRLACAGEPFYKEHEGQRYCVLHFPSVEKRADFQAALQKKLENEDFDFRGVWFPEEASFAELDFTTTADFSHATFTAAANFSYATFRADADFKEATLRAEAYFHDATFNGGADFGNATFSAHAFFSDVTFRADADCSYANFSAGADFGNASFSGANFFKTNFSGANFFQAAFSAEADFNEATFSAEADFNEATFSADVYFMSTTFSAAADFNDAAFSAGAYFSYATFSAGADFRQAAFHARADFTSATFSAKGYFFSATFSAAAIFSRATFADANFTFAIFSAAASFNEAIFTNYVEFAGNQERQPFGESSSFDLQFATIEQPDRVSFHTLTLYPHWFINIDPRKFDFTNVHWNNGGEAKPELEWLIAKIPRLAESSSEPADADRMRKQQIEKLHRLLAVACQRLAANCEDNSRYRTASDFRRMALDAERLETWGGFDVRRLNWWYWLASGYGERPFQALLMLVAILVLFGALYTQVGFARSEPRLASEADVATANKDEVGAPLRFSRGLSYSAGVMMLQKPEPKPATTAAQFLVLFETILGPVQAALLALAIRRKFMR